uniref:Variant surface glycoprotein 1433 n=1 Tax=Trypanosoma brucei TaxID=5691 RepID=M4SWE1_9TRYP|nr:variant surface glycoprotein 1433 [Trypanosoma brucei]
MRNILHHPGVIKLLTLLATAHVQADTNNAVAEAVTDSCKELAYVKALKSHIQQQTDNARTDFDSLRRHRQAWQTAATATQDPEKRCLFMALAAKAEDMEDRAPQHSKGAEETLNEAVSLLDQHLGLLQALTTAGQANLAEDAGKHSTTSNTAVNIKLKLAAGKTAVCAPVKDVKALQSPPADPDWSKLIKLKLTTPEQILTNFNEPMLTIGNLGSCQQNGGSSLTFGNAMQNCVQASTTATISSKDARPQAKYTATDVNLRTGDSYTGTCKQDLANPVENTAYEAKLGYFVCRALDTIKSKPGKLEGLSGSNLKSDAIVKLTLRNCLPQFQHITDTTDSEKSKQIEEYIEKTFHKNSNDFKTNFMDILTKDSHTSRSEKTSAQKSITGISNAHQPARKRNPH